MVWPVPALTLSLCPHKLEQGDLGTGVETHPAQPPQTTIHVEVPIVHLELTGGILLVAHRYHGRTDQGEVNLAAVGMARRVHWASV